MKPSKMILGEMGVFATVDLAKDTVIGDVRYLDEGPFVPWSKYDEFSTANKKKIDAFCLGTAEGFTLPRDFNYLSVPWCLNHSCDGNVGFDAVGNFVTMREVKAGEELSYDYGLAEANPRFRMVCKCGSEKCRGIITGDDWKNPVFQEKNKNYMLPELR